MSNVEKGAAPVSEAPEKYTILGEEVEVWPAHCVNNNNCNQCALEGKIRCAPQFWTKREEETALKPDNWNTMSRKERGDFFNSHRMEIEEDIKKLGHEGTIGKWGMASSTLSTIKRRWHLRTKGNHRPAGSSVETGEVSKRIEERTAPASRVPPGTFLLEEFNPGLCTMCEGPLLRGGSAVTLKMRSGAKIYILIYICNDCKLGAIRLLHAIGISVKEAGTTPVSAQIYKEGG